MAAVVRAARAHYAPRLRLLPTRGKTQGRPDRPDGLAAGSGA